MFYISVKHLKMKKSHLVYNASHSENSPFIVLFVFTDRHVEKESLSEYIAKKREMFLVQVMLFRSTWY